MPMVMILADGETYTELEGCRLHFISQEDIENSDETGINICNYGYCQATFQSGSMHLEPNNTLAIYDKEKQFRPVYIGTGRRASSSD